MGKSIDEQIIEATSANLLSSDWSLFLEVCDRLKSNPKESKEAIASIIRRIANSNANVVLYALELTSALVKNTTPVLHRELSSRAFVNTIRTKLEDASTHTLVKQRILALLQTWGKEMRGNHDMEFLLDTYDALVREGYDFPAEGTNSWPGEENRRSKEGTAQDRKKLEQQEREELELAIALSLSESEASRQPAGKWPGTHDSQGSGPTRDEQGSRRTSQSAAPVLYEVRGLYDFERVDNGELSFRAGEVLQILNERHTDWWMARSKRTHSIGLIPRNYVERICLSPSGEDVSCGRVSSVAASEDVELVTEEAVLRQNEKVDRLLQILSTPTVSGTMSENAELQKLFREILSVQPQLVKSLEGSRIERDRLQQLNEKFITARAKFDKMIAASYMQRAKPSQGPPQYGVPPASANAYGATPSVGPHAPSASMELRVQQRTQATPTSGGGLPAVLPEANPALRYGFSGGSSGGLEPVRVYDDGYGYASAHGHPGNPPATPPKELQPASLAYYPPSPATFQSARVLRDPALSSSSPSQGPAIPHVSMGGYQVTAPGSHLDPVVYSQTEPQQPFANQG